MVNRKYPGLAGVSNGDYISYSYSLLDGRTVGTGRPIPPPPPLPPRGLGFGLTSRTEAPPDPLTPPEYLCQVDIPGYAIAAALCCAIAGTRYRARRGRSLGSGLCPTCGYDVRVQKSGLAGDKCPECGTPIPGR